MLGLCGLTLSNSMIKGALHILKNLVLLMFFSVDALCLNVMSLISMHCLYYIISIFLLFLYDDSNMYLYE